LFLEDGRIELDTNPVENQIRPLVLTRKNSLFAGHDDGASYYPSADLLKIPGISGWIRKAADDGVISDERHPG
jgi:hypothetical protein